jgi:mandelate racemase
MASHIFQEITAHLMTVTPTGLRLEILELADPILTRPLHVSNGMAYPNTDSGNGLNWNEKVVERLRIT